LLIHQGIPQVIPAHGKLPADGIICLWVKKNRPFGKLDTCTYFFLILLLVDAANGLE